MYGIQDQTKTPIHGLKKLTGINARIVPAMRISLIGMTVSLPCLSVSVEWRQSLWRSRKHELQDRERLRQRGNRPAEVLLSREAECEGVHGYSCEVPRFGRFLKGVVQQGISEPALGL